MHQFSSIELRHFIPVQFDHRVAFSENIFDLRNSTLLDLIKNPSPNHRTKLIIFVDEGLISANAALYAQIQLYIRANPCALELSCPPILLPGGEPIKNNLFAFKKILKLLDVYKICRHSFVIVIGGGSLIDTVCFAASIVHRGIRQIRIPTTTLAQCDGAIGIKNGINFSEKKNFLGAFYPPFAVINDALFLETLDDQNWRNGFAEAIKVAIIKDRPFFEWIELMAQKLRLRDLNLMKILVRRCAELHLKHIAHSGDPIERGSSRPLDFGHWSAHKLEQLSGFSLSHGSAVAIGIALDTLYCKKAGYLEESIETRILACLEDLGFNLDHASLYQKDLEGQYSILAGIEEFREHLGGELSITLIAQLGKAFQINYLNPNLINQCILHLEMRSQKRRDGIPHPSLLRPSATEASLVTVE